MNKLTKAQNTKAINEAVKAFFNNGVSLDDTALSLSQNGVGFTDIQDTIQSVGVKNGWILTPDKIKEKVLSHIKDKTISHFLDVCQLAKSIDLAQLSQQEKQDAIIEFSGIAKSIVKEGRKFKQFHNSGHFGTIADWVKINPDFTPQQIHDSGLISAPNAGDYYDEFLAYREFYRTLDTAMVESDK